MQRQINLKLGLPVRSIQTLYYVVFDNDVLLTFLYLLHACKNVLLVLLGYNMNVSDTWSIKDTCKIHHAGLLKFY